VVCISDRMKAVETNFFVTKTTFAPMETDLYRRGGMWQNRHRLSCGST